MADAKSARSGAGRRSTTSILLTLSTLVAACGGGSAGHPPRSSTLAVKPWALEDDATSALILATAPGDVATVLELRPRGKAQLDAALLLEGAAQVQRLEVEVISRAALPLTGEPTAKALAPRAALAARIASEAAARLLGKGPEAYVWISSAGKLGADAGAEASLAVGFLAALTGAALDGKVALACSVLPDGSLGGAPDLAARVTSLARAGKKRIGVAAPMAGDGNGKPIALAPLARAGGAEVVLVSDVAEAYHLATGTALPVTAPVHAKELVLPEAARAQLAALYAAWQQRLGGDWAALLLLDNAARLPPRLAQLTAAAQREAKRAEELRKSSGGDGAMIAAIDRLREAGALANAAVSSFRIVELMEAGKSEEAAAVLRERAGPTGAGSLVDAVGIAAPSAVGDQLSRLALGGEAFRALASAKVSAQAIDAAAAQLAALAREPGIDLSSAETARRIAGIAAPPLLAHRRALGLAEVTRLLLELGALRDEGGGPPRPLAELSRSSPAAHLAVWSRALPSLAKEGASSASGAVLDPLLYPELALLALAESDAQPSGALASSSPLAAWAAAASATRAAGQLFAEREAFAVRRDVDGSVAAAGALTNALPSLLATAERHARVGAGAARAAIGAIPRALLVDYQLGQALARRPEVTLQLRALYAFWSASATADAALQLVRAARPAASATAPAARSQR